MGFFPTGFQWGATTGKHRTKSEGGETVQALLLWGGRTAGWRHSTTRLQLPSCGPHHTHSTSAQSGGQTLRSAFRFKSGNSLMFPAPGHLTVHRRSPNCSRGNCVFLKAIYEDTVRRQPSANQEESPRHDPVLATWPQTSSLWDTKFRPVHSIVVPAWEGWDTKPYSYNNPFIQLFPSDPIWVCHFFPDKIIMSAK